MRPVDGLANQAVIAATSAPIAKKKSAWSGMNGNLARSLKALKSLMEVSSQG